VGTEELYGLPQMNRHYVKSLLAISLVIIVCVCGSILLQWQASRSHITVEIESASARRVFEKTLENQGIRYAHPLNTPGVYYLDASNADLVERDLEALEKSQKGDEGK
jgi:hypothetical protein